MWPCEAYGPEAMKYGAYCFVAAQLHERVCTTKEECHRLVVSERQRVYRRIQELAADGDPVMTELAEQFPDPNTLLGGGDQE